MARFYAKTPARKKERIYGSKVNPKGSAASAASAKAIRFDKKTIAAIRKKVDNHNYNYPDRKIPISTAAAVVRRGMGAYSTSHSPTITGGKPNNRVAWGLARLNAFMHKVRHTKSTSEKYNQDNDLLATIKGKMELGGMVEHLKSPIITTGMQNGLSQWGGSPTTVFAEGGRVGDGQVKIVNQDVAFDESMYKGILDDFDADGLPNADDPNPRRKGDTKSVEQVKFTDTFKKVLNTKNELDDTMQGFVDELKKTAPSTSKIYARTKTPFSILNKLVSKRMLDQKKGLTDLIGTTIAVDTFAELERVAKRIDKGLYGKVIEVVDFYKNPNNGYMALHYIIERDGTLIEVQLKTKRMKNVNMLSHDAYKKGTLNAPYLLYLTTLAHKADMGDKSSAKEFENLMKDKSRVEKQLNKS